MKIGHVVSEELQTSADSTKKCFYFSVFVVLSIEPQIQKKTLVKNNTSYKYFVGQQK